MGDPQGDKELIPCSDGKLCSTSPYFMPPIIRMVDPACAGEAQLHHWKAEVKLLGSNAHVWRQDPQVSAIGKGI